MNYTRGSEWRKWNLHIHTPGTALNDQFAGATEDEKWENYLQRIEAVQDVAVLGITDYFSIEGYQKLKLFQAQGRISKIAALLPNVEVRILPATGYAHAINLHVIFSPEVVDLLDSQFFQALTFTFDNNSYRCTRTDLVRLGRDFSHDPHKEERSAYEAGVNQFKISFEMLRDVLRKNKNLHHKYLVAVPNGSQDGNSGLQDASLAATRQEIYRLAHIIFSGRPADVAYFLGDGPDTPDQVKEKCGSLKPCVTGCDAHELTRICQPDQDRFTWIKADPTFEGLRQIIFEPKERVRIQATNPTLEFTKPYFGEVCFRSDITVFQPSAQYEGTVFAACNSLPLNPAMVCVIGGRGTGKSCLVDYVGRAFGNIARRPEVTYSDDFVVRFNKDATSVDERGAFAEVELPFVYIAQNEVKEKIASGTVGAEIKRMLGLEEKGVVDELGIGVIRDAFADLLFPGISTIQTRAKYFLIIPRLLKDYEALTDRQRRSQSLVNFLSEQEKQCRIRLVEKYGKQDNLGIIGVSFGVRANADVQRRPSSVYWNGLRTFGIIKTDLSLAEYCHRHSGRRPSLRLLLEASQEERGDDVDAEDVSRSPVITLPPAPDWPERVAITLQRNEAAFLRQQIVAARPQSLLGQILMDGLAQAQFLALPQQASFADLAALPFIKQLPAPQLRQVVLRAELFWELLRGAHIRYNCLLQDKFGTPDLATEYGSLWADWRQEAQSFPWSHWDTDAMWINVQQAGGRVNHYTRKFVENWIELARQLPPTDAAFDECVIRQERANKGARARLRPDNRDEQVSGWIGIDRLNYRLPQAWRIVRDIQQAESGKEGGNA